MAAVLLSVVELWLSQAASNGQDRGVRFRSAVDEAIDLDRSVLVVVAVLEPVAEQSAEALAAPIPSRSESARRTRAATTD